MVFSKQTYLDVSIDLFKLDNKQYDQGDIYNKVSLQILICST